MFALKALLHVVAAARLGDSWCRREWCRRGRFAHLVAFLDGIPRGSQRMEVGRRIGAPAHTLARVTRYHIGAASAVGR